MGLPQLLAAMIACMTGVVRGEHAQYSRAKDKKSNSGGSTTSPEPYRNWGSESHGRSRARDMQRLCDRRYTVDQLKADGAMLDQKGESSPQASLGFRVSERLGYGQAISQVVEERGYSIPSCRRLPGSQEVRLGA